MSNHVRKGGAEELGLFIFPFLSLQASTGPNGDPGTRTTHCSLLFNNFRSGRVREVLKTYFLYQIYPGLR